MKLEHDEDDLKAAKEYFLAHVAFSTDDENAWMRVKKIAQQMYLAGLHARSRPEPGGEKFALENLRSDFEMREHLLRKELAELKERLKLTDEDKYRIDVARKYADQHASTQTLLMILDRITSSRGNE